MLLPSSIPARRLLDAAFRPAAAHSHRCQARHLRRLSSVPVWAVQAPLSWRWFNFDLNTFTVQSHARHTGFRSLSKKSSKPSALSLSVFAANTVPVAATVQSVTMTAQHASRRQQSAHVTAIRSSAAHYQKAQSASSSSSGTVAPKSYSSSDHDSDGKVSSNDVGTDHGINDDSTSHLDQGIARESTQPIIPTNVASRYSSSAAHPPPPLERGLYLVPTPIGNLEDITLRALRVLQSADLVLAEDTRHTRKLLQHYGISTPTLSYHAHNEHGRTNSLVQRLQQGEVFAMVSDAGTPAISDPGYLLVAATVAAGVRVFPLPGPCALITALIASGLPTDSFLFGGFLPAKQTARCKVLQAARDVKSTLLYYVPPHALAAVLQDMANELGGERLCCVARELSKVHEELLRCTVSEAAAEFRSREPRGEIVVAVAGCSSEARASAAATEDDPRVITMLQELLGRGLPLSTAVREVARALGVHRKAAYALALRLNSAAAAKNSSGQQVHATGGTGLSSAVATGAGVTADM